VPYKHDFFYDGDIAWIEKNYGESLDFRRFLYYIVKNDLDIDIAWDDYVKRWKEEFKGNELIEAYKKLPVTEKVLKGSLAY
jgi:hypothetical protein